MKHVPSVGVLYKDDGFFTRIQQWIPFTDDHGRPALELIYDGSEPGVGKYRFTTANETFELDRALDIKALADGRIRATFLVLSSPQRWSAKPRL